MAQNEHINKVVYNGNTLIDLTNDTLTKETLIGETTKAFLPSGELVNGSDLGALVVVNNKYVKLILSTSMARVEGTKLIIEEAE